MSEVPPFSAETVHEERVAGAAPRPVVASPAAVEPVVEPVAPYPARPVAAYPAEPVAPYVGPVAPAGAYTRVTRSAAVYGNPRAWRYRQIVWLVLGIVETLIGLRVLLLALDANRDAGFTRFVYDLSSPLVAPFRNLFRDYVMGGTGVLETGSLVAMLVYLLAAALVIKVIDVLNTPGDTRATSL